MRRTRHSVWGNRDIQLLVAGTIVNSIGDWLLGLALPLYIFVETGSGLATSAVYLLNLGVGAVLGPLGGRLVDMWPLKTTLVVTNLLQIVALTPLLFATPDRVWPVFVVVVLQGLVSSVNDPASFALVPRLVADDELVAANSALSAGGSLSRLIGAAAGGLALELGGMALVAILDGSTFLVAALASAMLSSKANQVHHSTGEADGSAEAPDGSVRTGFREITARRGLVGIVLITALSTWVFGGFELLFIVFVTEYLNGTETDVGIIRSSSAIGGLIGAAVVGRLSAKVAPPWLLTTGFFVFGVISMAFVNAPFVTTALWLSVLLYGATGIPNVASGVGSSSTVQQLTPGEVMGRVGGVMASVSKLMFGLGALSAGLLLEVTTARVLLNVEATVFFVCALIAYVFVVDRGRTVQSVAASA